LDTDNGSQKQAEEDQNTQQNQGKKVVSHRIPDEAAEASVKHWPDERW
jgi:hypothetical protein